MKDKRASLAIVVWAGSLLFVAAVLLVCFRIYDAFSSSGIPVNSAGKVVGTLDAGPVVALFALGSLLIAGLISWTTWRKIWRDPGREF